MTIQINTNPLALSEAPRQKTAAVLKFERWADEVRNLLDGKSPEDQKKAVAANADFVRGLNRPRFSTDGLGASDKAVTPAAVHVDALMSNFSTMYANSSYIGEQLMPVVSVSKRSDKYAAYPKRGRFAFPDDEFGARSSPNELEETRSTDNYSVKDYGFKNFLDLDTLANQDAPLNEMLDLLESIMEGIAFKREKRILTIIGTAGNYGSNTGAASNNWNATDGGDVIDNLLTARAALYTGKSPTKLIGACPLAVWNSGIANNPKIRDLFKYTGAGLAVTTQVARYFRLDDILITEAREDTANEGQTASYARMMTGDVFAVLAVAQRPTLRSLHFGSTFRMNGTPITTEWTDPNVGVRGGIWAKVAVSEDHKVVAGDAGYLITGITS
jgi:hypothetical protein